MNKTKVKFIYKAMTN